MRAAGVVTAIGLAACSAGSTTPNTRFLTRNQPHVGQGGGGAPAPPPADGAGSSASGNSCTALAACCAGFDPTDPALAGCRLAVEGGQTSACASMLRTLACGTSACDALASCCNALDPMNPYYDACRQAAYEGTSADCEWMRQELGCP